LLHELVAVDPTARLGALTLPWAGDSGAPQVAGDPVSAGGGAASTDGEPWSAAAASVSGATSMVEALPPPGGAVSSFAAASPIAEEASLDGESLDIEVPAS